MDAMDGFAHTGDVILENGDKKEHIASVDCWCQPIRHRYNSLMRQWEVWDRDNFRWVILEPQPEPPLDVATAQALKERSTPATPQSYDVVAEMEGRDADREAARYEDDIKRNW